MTSEADKRVVAGTCAASEVEFEASLRPARLNDFVGQEKVRENLSVYIQSAKMRKDVLDHILFSGMPGLGKTTLSHIISAEMGTHIWTTSGPALAKAADLAGILTNLQEGDVFFIDEIHRLSPVVEEYLYGAMEDFALELVIDQGPSARTVRLQIPRFTLVGATTREGLLSAPFRGRFGVLEKLQAYPNDELVKIVLRSASILGILVDMDAAKEMAMRARGTPRVVNRFLRRVRDVAMVKGAGAVDLEATKAGMLMLGVDEKGLDATDRSILETLTRTGGRPMGLKTIAATVGEEDDTISDVYEPFLIKNGFLERQPNGRIATPLAYEHLGLAAPKSTSDQTGLF